MARVVFSPTFWKATMVLWDFAGLFPSEEEEECLFWTSCGLGHPPKLVGEAEKRHQKNRFLFLCQSRKLKRPFYLPLSSFISHLGNGAYSNELERGSARGCHNVSDSSLALCLKSPSLPQSMPVDCSLIISVEIAQV